MDNVVQHYDRAPEYEWQRLVKDAFHGLEFRATMACLAQHVAPKSRVLDAGGGPGRYALELCRQGHRVTLLDRSPGCIARARELIAQQPQAVQEQMEAIDVGDVRDLSRFADGSFDVVLCLGGPLSHLIRAEDRTLAIRELVRVARRGGMVVISVMGYLAVLRTVLLRSPSDLSKPEREALFSGGDHLYTGGYCDTHFYRPEELRAMAESAGMETVEMRACEGLSSNLREATNALAAAGGIAWERWVRLLDDTAQDPAVIATSEHFLYVGRVAAG